MAEVCNTYVKKGMLVQVIGRLKGDDKGNPRTYESNGKTSASFEMTANSVNFLSRADTEEQQPAAPAVQEDEYPF